jgi:ribosomal protein S18 acetylase RimI-like enzyme
VKQLAKLYQTVFKDNFSAHLGQSFLNLFCEQFVNSFHNYGYIVKDRELIIGFILGTTSPDNLYRKFYRDNMIPLTFLILSKFFSDKFVRRNISKRVNHIVRALKAFVVPAKKTTKTVVEKTDTRIPARVLAIGISPEYRSRGIASLLTKTYCEKVKSEGFKKVELSAKPGNKQAISFYKKDGWNIDNVNDTAVSFSRLLNTP